MVQESTRIHPNPTLQRIRPNPESNLTGSKCPYRLYYKPKNPPTGLLGIHPNPTLDRIRPNPETPTPTAPPYLEQAASSSGDGGGGGGGAGGGGQEHDGAEQRSKRRRGSRCRRHTGAYTRWTFRLSVTTALSTDVFQPSFIELTDTLGDVSDRNVSD